MPLKGLLVCIDRTDAGYGRLELAMERPATRRRSSPEEMGCQVLSRRKR